MFPTPVSAKYFNDLGGESLKRLQSKLDGVYYFIIDEKSVVDLRLRQAFSKYKNRVWCLEKRNLLPGFRLWHISSPDSKQYPFLPLSLERLHRIKKKL